MHFTSPLVILHNTLRLILSHCSSENASSHPKSNVALGDRHPHPFDVFVTGAVVVGMGFLSNDRPKKFPSRVSIGHC